MTQPETTPATERRPTRRPWDALLPTMYRVSWPGVRFSRIPLTMKSARCCVPNMANVERQFEYSNRYEPRAAPHVDAAVLHTRRHAHHRECRVRHHRHISVPGLHRRG